MKRIGLFLGLALLLAGCGPRQVEVSDEAVQTALVELVAERTQAAETTPSAPVETPAQDASPSPSPTATELTATAPHGDGLYLVGVDIEPGLWRSTASDQRFCYWARRKYDGVILASYYGLPGGDLLVSSTDYEVELDGCGIWIHVGPR
jgi:hypothetical protein